MMVDLKVMAYFKISLSTRNWDRAITKRYPYRVIWSHRMTTHEKVARCKLSLLALAKELNNV
ncbi:hypothetical protein, partial [Aeromonas veronii]|uniref:hypothetical protein n=1 Tax=Aeromonas veronii TaxID=654 RepID=UPI003B9F9582